MTLHTSRTAERMLFTLRARTFAHLQRLSLDYYDKEMGGRIMTRMTTDVEALRPAAAAGPAHRAGQRAHLRRRGGRPARARRPPGPRAFVVLPPLIVVTVWFRRRSSRAVPARSRARRRLYAEMQESLSGSWVTQSLGREDNNEERFGAPLDDYRDARLRSMQLMAIYFPSASSSARSPRRWRSGSAPT